MAIFTLKSVKKDFGIKEILRDATFSINETEKVGLIGTNGSGKSTLLKILAGLEPIDEGEFQVNQNARCIYLPQQPEVDETKTVLEQVLASSGEQIKLIQEYETLSEKLATAPNNNQLLSRFSKITQQMDAMGTWDLDTKAKIILNKLGLGDPHTPVKNLSGGERKRVALTAALLSEPSALLMDEPTNHLDADSVAWLQDYLKNFRGALLLVTHDRYFLDQVTSRIIEIDRADLYTYDGNYSYYLEKKAEIEAAQASHYQKYKSVLRRELAWLKQGPKARSTKQKARIKAIDELQNQEFKEAKGNVDISTPTRRIGKKVIAVENVNKSYQNRQLINDFTYEFNPRDRVGIIGQNGAGKSTLMDIVTGRIPPDSGKVEIGETIHIGYFDQHSENLLQAKNENQRVIEYLKDVAEFVKTADGTLITASQMLERFLFPPNQQYLPLHKLSGGEKRRLFLLKVLMSAPNVLILDEPTNDLDVQTLSILEDYLQEFNGCVITVSHDRYFLDRTVTQIFAFTEGGTIKFYPGNYSTYLDYKEAEEASENTSEKKAAKAEKTKTEVNGKGKKQKTDKPRRLSNWERRELEDLETKIPQLEAEKTELETALYHTPSQKYSELQKLSEQVATLEQQIEEATERWLELAEIES
ncbi:ABC transporter related protein [Halothece sp. PCC 7418]|uniref:ABC-F family ATP-binding cassette domain-containing protein n=1 Tax=Halothece sp. (strain PCC 7418) TaxID=65093 RepID=UPI0002A05F7C|nr:ABC-F family ATP-binding cassette domain-containing protein [Halothece sp. PCC 7418]AFZ42596.1 ABC transporter related protein [Halothece sp. PCC 7418]